MKLYSDAFLNDSYLKYVGWTMHDKVSAVIQDVPFVCSLCVCERKQSSGKAFILSLLQLLKPKVCPTCWKTEMCQCQSPGNCPTYCLWWRHETDLKSIILNWL